MNSVVAPSQVSLDRQSAIADTQLGNPRPSFREVGLTLTTCAVCLFIQVYIASRHWTFAAFCSLIERKQTYIYVIATNFSSFCYNSCTFAYFEQQLLLQERSSSRSHSVFDVDARDSGIALTLRRLGSPMYFLHDTSAAFQYQNKHAQPTSWPRPAPIYAPYIALLTSNGVSFS